MPYATAADANEIYPLGTGDKLRVTVFGEDTLSGEYTVTGDGDISFPLIGNVPASGRSIEELQATLTAMLDNGYVNDPRVSAEVLEYRPYYILGEVNRPGEYPYSVGLTVEQAVATAGGYTYRANDERVFLKRSDDTQEKLVDLERSPAFRLRPGDTVRVGERYF
ncbi:polysaccharide biosynthesis/export family protein [Qipengyuania seohaensis]|uniref:polysaccharide biosynthesis/export family protein n=1 Tax=Qipengyuania seohaensis TaxID=266951 RepID=UPI001E500FE1|nr:polysaccharide biosynthesis/export family protein [Qipengyuania seohaensis]